MRDITAIPMASNVRMRTNYMTIDQNKFSILFWLVKLFLTGTIDCNYQSVQNELILSNVTPTSFPCRLASEAMRQLFFFFAYWSLFVNRQLACLIPAGILTRLHVCSSFPVFVSKFADSGPEESHWEWSISGGGGGGGIMHFASIRSVNATQGGSCNQINSTICHILQFLRACSLIYHFLIYYVCLTYLLV